MEGFSTKGKIYKKGGFGRGGFIGEGLV